MTAVATKWFGVAATILGVLVAAATLGLVMPWQAISKAEADIKYETRQHADEIHQHLEAEIKDTLNIILEEIRRRP